MYFLASDISTWMLPQLFLHNISEICVLSLELAFLLKQTILLIQSLKFRKQTILLMQSLKFRTTSSHLTCLCISSSVILFPPLCHPPKSCVNPLPHMYTQRFFYQEHHSSVSEVCLLCISSVSNFIFFIC